MMLYEINLLINQLTDQIEIDEETGEVLCDFDAIMEQINALDMERHSILEYLAKLVLNYRAEAAAIKGEEERLKKRRSYYEKKEERLLAILDRECAGETTDLGIAKFSYRKTTKVDVIDAARAIRWLKRNGHKDCFRTPEPEVNKADVKRLLSAGTNVPGTSLVTGKSYSLK